MPNPSVAFAASRSRAGTSAGTAAREAGWKTCPVIARAATSASSNGSGGSPIAITTSSAACSSSQVIITRRRSKRSLTAPVSGLSSDGTKSPASSSAATASACPVVCATCSISATRLSESPTNDTTRATISDRNAGRPRSSARAPAALIGSPTVWHARRVTSLRMHRYSASTSSPMWMSLANQPNVVSRPGTSSTA